MKGTGVSESNSTSSEGNSKLPPGPRPPSVPSAEELKVQKQQSVRSRQTPRGASVLGTRASMPHPPAREQWTLNVGTLTGKTFTIPVISTDTIGEVKCRIYEEEGIPVGAQVLVWKEKELSDDNAMVCDYGLCSGATLQLTLQMSGGPGPPMRLKKPAKEEDSVVLLLCKQNEDLYMLEFHMKDPKGRQTATQQLYRLATGEVPPSLFPDLRQMLQQDEEEALNRDGRCTGVEDRVESAEESDIDSDSYDENNSEDDRDGTSSNEGGGDDDDDDADEEDCDDDGADDDDDLELDAEEYIENEDGDSDGNETDDDYDRCRRDARRPALLDPDDYSGEYAIGGRTKSSKYASRRQKVPAQSRRRPLTSASTMSTDTFLSLLAPSSSETSPRNTQTLVYHRSKYGSRGDSRPSSGGSSLPETSWDARNIDSQILRSVTAMPAPGYHRRVIQGKIRPATAISVMRLAGGATPMIIVPKHRPASAYVPLRTPSPVLRQTPSPQPSSPSRSPQTPSRPRKSSKREYLSPTPPPFEPNMPGRRGRKIRKKAVRFDVTATDMGDGRQGRESDLECLLPLINLPPLSDHSSILTQLNQELVEFQTFLPRLAQILPPPSSEGDLCESLARLSEPVAPRRPGTFSPRKRSSTPHIPPANQKLRCALCKKKLGLAACFKCRCDETFCSVHRYTDRHQCPYDYKEAGRITLAKENPLIKNEKVQKI